MPEAKVTELTSKEKAAILLISLGPEKSAAVFRHLKEEEIESITLQIANIQLVLPEVREAVIEEFYQICLAQQYIAEGGLSYARQILEKALGQAKAHEVINKLTVSLQVKPFDFIRKIDASQILSFIQNEHPQTIALILAFLKPKQAAEVISNLPADKQFDVAKRIATMDRTPPDVIKEVEKSLEKKLSTLMTNDYSDAGGVDTVVDILNAVDISTNKNIMDQMEAEDADLSDEIKKKMFVLEDIITLDNRAIQLVLRQDIDNRELAVALKGASPELQNVILSNMSKRLAAMIKDDMDYMGPVRRSDVEEAQQKIVNIVRRLQDSGEIIIARGGGADEIIL